MCFQPVKDFRKRVRARQNRLRRACRWYRPDGFGDGRILAFRRPFGGGIYERGKTRRTQRKEPQRSIRPRQREMALLGNRQMPCTAQTQRSDSKKYESRCESVSVPETCQPARIRQEKRAEFPATIAAYDFPDSETKPAYTDRRREWPKRHVPKGTTAASSCFLRACSIPPNFQLKTMRRDAFTS